MINQSEILVLKDTGLNANPYFNLSIPNKGKLQQIEYGYAVDIDSVRSRRALPKNGTYILVSKNCYQRNNPRSSVKEERECITMKNWFKKHR